MSAAEAGLPLAIGFGRDVGRRALAFDQIADAARVIDFVRQHDGARIKAIEQRECGWCVVRLSRCQTGPDGQALSIDDRVYRRRESAPGATETMISTPPFLRSQLAGAPGCKRCRSSVCRRRKRLLSRPSAGLTSPPVASARNGCSRSSSARSVPAGLATAHPNAASRRCRSATAGHRRAAHPSAGGIGSASLISRAL